MMAAVKVAHGLHFGLVESTVGQGRLDWCPVWFLSKFPHSYQWALTAHHLCQWPRSGETSNFKLQPLAVSYFQSVKPLTKVGSVIYQIDETELSFLECGIRICLQADAEVVCM